MLSEMYEWYMDNLDSERARTSQKSIAQKMFTADASSSPVDLHSGSYYQDILSMTPLEVFHHFHGTRSGMRSRVGWEMLEWGADVAITISPWTPSKMRAAAFARVLATIDEKY